MGESGALKTPQQAVPRRPHAERPRIGGNNRYGFFKPAAPLPGQVVTVEGKSKEIPNLMNKEIRLQRMEARVLIEGAIAVLPLDFPPTMRP